MELAVDLGELSPDGISPTALGFFEGEVSWPIVSSNTWAIIE
jgi:hypothetical protein